MNISDLRAEMGLSLFEFAVLVGQRSRGTMSVIERDNRCSVRVALRIEELSGGRIDAAALNDDVRMARASCTGGCINIATGAAPSPGKSPGNTGAYPPAVDDDAGANALSGGGASSPAAPAGEAAGAEGGPVSSRPSAPASSPAASQEAA